MSSAAILAGRHASAFGERDNFLGDAVLEDLEIFGRQSARQQAALAAHDDRHAHEIDAGFERLLGVDGRQTRDARQRNSRQAAPRPDCVHAGIIAGSRAGRYNVLLCVRWPSRTTS